MATPSTTPRLAPTALSTPHQRLYIRTLGTQLDLDNRRVTLFHGRFFEAAGIPAPPLGTDFDAFLCALTKAQASALATAMKEEAGDE